MPSEEATTTATAAPIVSRIIEDVSQFKHEYLDMEVHCLVEGEVKSIKLGDFSGRFVAILFYEADFAHLIREELLELMEKIERFKEANCQVLACSTDSVHVHLAWQNTNASEEADGLGRKTPFPLLGDKNQRLSRSFGVLDESKGTAKHALLLLNGLGDLVYREMLDSAVKVNFETVFAAITASKSAQSPDIRDIREVSGDIEDGEKEDEVKPFERVASRLSYAVVEEVEEEEEEEKEREHHNVVVYVDDVDKGAEIKRQDAITEEEKPDTGNAKHVLETVVEKKEEEKPQEKLAEAVVEKKEDTKTLEDLKKELELTKTENAAPTPAKAAPSSTTKAKVTKPESVAPKKKSKKEGDSCCVLS